MSDYITVRKHGRSSLTVKKSEFIGYCAHVTSEEEARGFIDEIRKKHSDARHNVYAYVLKNGNTARYSDDREPQGSAGLPVLGVIEKSGVTDTVIVVTRYFGGILLGTGGLARAYSDAARGALNDSGIAEFSYFRVCRAVFPYPYYGKIQKILSVLNAIVDSVDFADSVTLVFAVREELAGNADSAITEACAGRVTLTRLDTRLDSDPV